ncbi:peptidase S41 [Aliidiomarina sedimenti]|uniref:Tricorn protease homolog n=1 Tax=Aliidiomarina sedimenti TaxID=1933879 RepID=A0ABY0BXS6_9GAMM|nr:S41 family peptidase [Aliidiomarina sedimenti]RUO29163.1 peptidase S41 [Aliidiomarina sedimenti]
MKLALYLASGALLASGSMHVVAEESTRGYYRNPSIHQNQIVFTAEGDLWRTTVHGGNATRLTTSDAEERYAAISPDGDWVAYVADYEGAPEAYVMPLQGGIPKRITFENSRVRVQGWTADGQVLYSTDHVMGPANQWLLRSVNPESLTTSTIPLTDAIEGSYNLRAEGRVIEHRSDEPDADGNYEVRSETIHPVNPETLYFTRFGLQATGDNTRIYRGGAMGQLWRFNPGDEEAELLTDDHIASVRQPMVDGTRVYFISDATGTPNLWSMNGDGSEKQQVTEYNDWQVWSADISQGRIVYQLGADLKLLDLESGQSETLDIQLTSDFAHRQERWIENPLDYLTDTSYNGEQERVVITARSQIAVAGKSHQRLFEVQTPVGSRSRGAVMSPDGRWIYALNDHSGENEIWRFPADGSSGASQLTDDGNVFRWGIHLSPDGNYLAHDDKNGDLWLLNLSNGSNRRIAEGGWGHSPYADVVWSTDSKLLAFSKSNQDGDRSQVLLYSVDEERQQAVSTTKYDSFSPAFSTDGHWLYFVSNRNFDANPRSPWGDRNLGPMFDKRGLVFAVSLKSQACFPFQPESEVSQCDPDATEERSRRQPVDWDGLADRLWQVPLEAGNYRQLQVSDEFLYLLRAGDSHPQLISVAIDPHQPEVKVFASQVEDYAVSSQRDSLYWRTSNNDFYIDDVQATAPDDLSRSLLATDQWQLAFNPVEEWQQMFRDAWLMHRDFLFDADMRGLDWRATREKYQSLLPRVTDRHELDDLFAQMMGELSVLHSQVRGGDYPAADDQPSAATLGAALETTDNGVRILRIYRTDPELPEQASPLAKPGVNATEGDYITAVNGRHISTQADLSQALRNQANKPVRLDLRRERSSLQTMVYPATVQEDHQLRYQDWVQRNREKVDAASEQNFGYLHLYAMGPNDIASFAREFYANVDREGLIIDVRRNRGGNIDSWIIEKLLRRAWSFWEPNTHGAPYTNMQQTFRGHLVILTDELTYSDGETFAAGVKALGLGPLVGKRTAGAGVWLSGRNQLADGGLARVAETAQFAMDGRWVIEGYGVEPDIEVDNLPHATFNGIDAQLNYAIELLQRKLDDEPIPELRSQPIMLPVADDITP